METAGTPGGQWEEEGRPPVGEDPAGTPPRPGIPDAGWRIGRFLGAGSTGSVWLVQRRAEPARYALKVPHRPEAAADEFEIRRELTILSRFRHENLLGVHGLLATERGPGLLLEYAAGDSLARLLDVRTSLGPGEAVTVLVAVARALACLHAEGAAHGDVAPGNVLFTANGKPLLADFGTGRMLAENREAGTGTPGFTAADPGGRGAGSEADVFALGALGWFMLTGRALLPGLRPPLSVVLPDLPAGLRDLLDAALDDDPSRRPSADSFAAGVFRAFPAEPLDLLASVHPSVRPELRTRRSALQQDKPGRKLPRPARRSRRVPWEEAGTGRRRGAAAPAPVRRPRWLGAATVLVGAVAAFGAVAVLAPEVFGPAAQVVIPASREVPRAAPADPEGAARGDRDSSAATAEPGTGEAAGGSSAVEPAEEPSGSAAVPSGPEVEILNGDDPLTAVRILSGIRARAFETGNPALLGWVNAEGSPAAEADAGQVQMLQARRERLSGLKVQVLDAARAGGTVGTPDREQVAVTVESSGFTQLRADGSAVAPGAPERQEIILELVRADAGWRIARVLPATASLDQSGGAQR